jgi:hypothetical protein
MSLANIIKTFQCSLQPKTKVDENEERDKKIICKISDSLLQEINIACILKPYSLFFSIIQNSTPVICRYHDEREKVSDNHLLVTFKNVREKHFLRNMWQTSSISWQLLWYRQVLASLEILQRENLCYFHWTSKSIFVDDFTERAMIQGFAHSFSLDNVDFDDRIKRENVWLPEWKLVRYMKENNLSILSFSDLCMLGEKFEKSAFMKSLTNTKLDNILLKMNSWRETWDLYCFHALLLSWQVTLPPFLSKICHEYVLKDPNKRENIKSFICLYDAELKNYLISSS